MKVLTLKDKKAMQDPAKRTGIVYTLAEKLKEQQDKAWQKFCLSLKATH